ncbi:MAG TPA: hypothetical protein VEW48_16960 [Thermoanaerobaculia bacterium]|nr:hypothetical protein [Thermoanaerobaculia bacterium]
MSSQHFRLHRPVNVVAALALVSMFALPPAWAQEMTTIVVEVTALDPGQSPPAFELRSTTFQAAGSAEDDPIIDEVDPWDDDLGGKKPPGSAVGVLTVEAVSDGAVQLVLRNSEGLVMAVLRGEGAEGSLRLTRALAAGRYFLEVESLNGDDAEYALTLHRPGRR